MAKKRRMRKTGALNPKKPQPVQEEITVVTEPVVESVVKEEIVEKTPKKEKKRKPSKRKGWFSNKEDEK